MTLPPSELKELGERARRLLREKGRPYSGAMGFIRVADTGAVAIVQGSDYTVNVHLPNAGKWGKSVYTEDGEYRTMLYIDDELSPIALEKLRGLQVLDDLATC